MTPGPTAIIPFPPRQRQVGDLLITGMCSKQAARQLGCSSRTIEDHAALVLRVYDARNMIQVLRPRRAISLVEAGQLIIAFPAIQAIRQIEPWLDLFFVEGDKPR